MKTLRELLQQGVLKLKDTSGSAKLDAELLLCYTTGCSRVELLTHADEKIEEGLAGRYLGLIERRSLSEPVAYITGRKEFWGLELVVTRDTLTPRPETEHVVAAMLSLIDEFSGSIKILDLGTGTGCISVALGTELRKRGVNFSITAIDKSGDALGVAQQNIAKFELGEFIKTVQSDWFSEVPDSEVFSFIVSNPPYVACGDARVSKEVAFEPEIALYAGGDGLDQIRRILPGSLKFLTPGGYLIFEMGMDQGRAVKALIDCLPEDQGSLELTNIMKDLSGLERVCCLRKTP